MRYAGGHKNEQDMICANRLKKKSLRVTYMKYIGIIINPTPGWGNQRVHHYPLSEYNESLQCGNSILAEC